jgi:anti-sigma regulatory factor (Ser/Thr protein kinase)
VTALPSQNGTSMSGYTARLDLPTAVVSVPVARHVTLDVLRSWGSPHDLDDAALLVSELVSNVVDHAHAETALTLELSLAGDWLRISVADGSAIRPVVREMQTHRPRGRGLQLVEAIADRWGVEDHHGGKRIWFELRAPTR